MAKLSLQEQMLKAGLVNQKKLKKAKKGSKKSRDLAKEVKASVEQNRNEQQARTKELNAQQQNQKQQKEIQAQIKQLIEMNKLELNKNSDLKFNFTDGTVIRFVYVMADIREQLVNGLLAIAKYEGGYVVIPTSVAKKIAMRDESKVIINEVEDPVADEDDPYADYAIPDDLMW